MSFPPRGLKPKRRAASPRTSLIRVRCAVRVKSLKLLSLGTALIFLRDFLALACGVLLALPPGWCCGLTGGKCCGGEARTTSCSLTTTPLGTKPECASGCCCAKDQSAGTTDPASPAPEKQLPAKKAECCKRAPSSAPEVSHLSVDVSATGLVAVFTFRAEQLFTRVRADAPPRSAHPPLYLRHCVFLC